MYFSHSIWFSHSSAVYNFSIITHDGMLLLYSFTEILSNSLALPLAAYCVSVSDYVRLYSWASRERKNKKSVFLQPLDSDDISHRLIMRSVIFLLTISLFISLCTCNPSFKIVEDASSSGSKSAEDNENVHIHQSRWKKLASKINNNIEKDGDSKCGYEVRW